MVKVTQRVSTLIRQEHIISKKITNWVPKALGNSGTNSLITRAEHRHIPLNKEAGLQPHHPEHIRPCLNKEAVLTAIQGSKPFIRQGRNEIIRGGKLSQRQQTDYRQILYRVKEYCLTTVVINSGLAIAVPLGLQCQGHSCRYPAISLQ